MSWEQFHNIIAENRDFQARERSERPVACPNDGEILMDNGRGSLRCPMGDYQFNG